MANKVTAYEYDNKLYVPAEGTSFVVFENQDTKNKSQADSQEKDKPVRKETLSKQEYGMVISFGKPVDLDKTDIERLKGYAVQYEKYGKDAAYASMSVAAAKQVEASSREINESLNKVEQEITADEGGHKETEFATDKNANQRNNERTPRKKDEYTFEETFYGYDEDSGTSGQISGARSRDEANAKARIKAETGEWGKDAKIRNDLRDGNSLSEADVDYARDNIGEHPDERVHGDGLTEAEEKREFSLHDIDTAPPTFSTPHYDERETEYEDPIFSDPRWEDSK